MLLIILEYYKGSRGLADAILGARGWAAWVVVGVLIGALVGLGVGGGGCSEAGDQVLGIVDLGVSCVERRGWRCVGWFVCSAACLMRLFDLVGLGFCGFDEFCA